jgi:hypothetical protein
MSAFMPTCNTCEKKNSTCPILMSDGRSFGDIVYTSRCEQQYKPVIEQKQFTNNFEYRQYLIQNAEILMKENEQKAYGRLAKW